KPADGCVKPFLLGGGHLPSLSANNTIIANQYNGGEMDGFGAAYPRAGGGGGTPPSPPTSGRGATEPPRWATTTAGHWPSTGRSPAITCSSIISSRRTSTVFATTGTTGCTASPWSGAAADVRL